MNRLLLIRPNTALRWMIASFALTVFGSAQADAPALDAQQLGLAESMLKFCGPIDPGASKRLGDKVSQLTKGASEETVSKARESDQYRHAYESVSAFTAQIDAHNAKNFCAEPVKGK